MRMAFGLVALLVTVGVIFWIMGTVQLPYVQKGARDLRPQAEQMAGIGADGMRHYESIELEAETVGGRMRGLRVVSLVPGGPMEAHFGLRRGDVIVEAGSMRLRDLRDDAEMAEALVLEAYQRSQPLVVLRGGETIVLPQEPPPAMAPGPTRSPLQDQLDAIQRVPTH